LAAVIGSAIRLTGFDRAWLELINWRLLMRVIALLLAAAFALSIPAITVVKAEDTTIIKKNRDFDRDKVVIKKKEEPRHMYMYHRDRDDVYVHRHRPAVGVDVDVGR
jgi:hypothetical protein